jgi:hypothetical protein
MSKPSTAPKKVDLEPFPTDCETEITTERSPKAGSERRQPNQSPPVLADGRGWNLGLHERSLNERTSFRILTSSAWLRRKIRWRILYRSHFKALIITLLAQENLV